MPPILNQQSAIYNVLCPHCRHPIALQLVDGDPATPALDRVAGLPVRQCQVLNLLSQGLTTKQIAARLGLHPRTVGLHILWLKERFQAENIAHLIRLCDLEGK